MGKVSASIAKQILKWWGWKIEGKYAFEIPKKVMIAAPHTSGWDLPLGILTRTAIQADIQFVGKASLFKPPLGWIMRAVGGVPVDRSRSNNFVDAIVQVFNERESFSFMIAPEGTRHRVEKFKTGFYYVAKAANIPIQMIVLNYETKILTFIEPFYPTDDADKDIEFVESHFRGIKGKVVEKSFGT